MAQRLGAAGSFSQAARANMERQLGIARAAKEEAARDARAAMARVQSLESDLQQCTFNVASTLQSQARFRALAAAGWCIAIILGALTFGSNLAKFTSLPQQALNGDKGVTNINTTGPVIMPHDAAQNDPSTHLQGTERAGRAAVQDLPIRLAPNDDATIRAFLNRGEHLAIEREVRGPTQTWLLVRSATGTGWVRAGDVMH
jgi:hypothetical protein